MIYLSQCLIICFSLFRCEASLTNLDKFTQYSIHVQAFNEKGAGPPSDDVNVYTLEDGKVLQGASAVCSNPYAAELFPGNCLYWHNLQYAKGSREFFFLILINFYFALIMCFLITSLHKIIFSLFMLLDFL